MWRTVRQFCLVLYLVVSDSVICNALSRSQLPNESLRKITNIVENPVISNVKSKLILSNGSSTGKPAIVTLSSYSTFSNWDSRTTIQMSNLNQNPDDIIKEAYNKPVIFATSTPSKLNNTTTKKTGISVRNPITSFNARVPSEVKPCQRILAGSLCEDDVDYPADAARTLSKDEKFKSRYALYFAPESYKKSSSDEVNTRFDASSSPNLEGSPLCPTRDNLKVFRPTKLIDKNDKWKFILQHGGDNFTQVIQVEICANADGPCELLSSLTTGYRSQCVQKYSFRKLVWVLDDKEHGVDEFKVPSCCSCRYFPDNSLAIRLGANKQNKNGA